MGDDAFRFEMFFQRNFAALKGTEYLGALPTSHCPKAVFDK